MELTWWMAGLRLRLSYHLALALSAFTRSAGPLLLFAAPDASPPASPATERRQEALSWVRLRFRQRGAAFRARFEAIRLRVPLCALFKTAPSVAWGRPSRSTKQKLQIRKSKEASKWRAPTGIGIAINHHVFALSPTVGRLAWHIPQSQHCMIVS